MQNNKIIGYYFPFIPLTIGFLLVLLQTAWGKPDPQRPLALMFVIIISCLISWMFTTAGLAIFKERLFNYYRTLFTAFSVINILPAIILALFIPWSLLFSIAIFVAGLFQIIRHNK